MRNAALVLGIIAGIWGMIVGFFGYGYTEFIAWFGEVPDLAEQVDHPTRVRTLGLLAPILAIAGGAMARSAALVGGGLLLASLQACTGRSVLTYLPCFRWRWPGWVGFLP